MTVRKAALDDHILGDWIDVALDDLPAIHFIIDDESDLTFHLTAIGPIPSGYGLLQYGL